MTYRIGRLPVLLAVWLAALGTPISVAAGNLEPPGPPAPSMKSLEEVQPTWSLKLDATDGEANGCNSTRFACIWNNAAVRDNETGIIWQRTPGSIQPGGQEETWALARLRCAATWTGGRGGWRLPSIAELTSLFHLDYPATAPFDLPPVLERRFWTMTTDTENPGSAWLVRATLNGNAIGPRQKTSQRQYWCVRTPGPLSDY